MLLFTPRVVAGRFVDATCALGGAVGGMLWFAGAIGPMAGGIRRVTDASERLEPYLGFVLVTVVALLGVGVGLGVRRALRGFAGGRVASVVVLVLVAALGLHHARWLVWGAPAFVLLAAPMFVTGRVRPVPRRDNQRDFALACIASEGACVGVGAWFSHAALLPSMLLPSMLVFGAITTYVAAAHASDDMRWHMVLAGLPCLLLPFVGLERNPTTLPTILACVLAAAVLVALSRWPGRAERARAWARRHAPGLAMPALLLVLIVPWHFRDLGVADFAGHEGQHYGWINSITFGKLMMADAGFTYGPAREYTLAALAWAMGGLTIEHVRLAHVAVNVAGLLCVFAAMRRVSAGQIHALPLGLGLVVTHSAIASLVVYTKTYSLGWADACRAGLATLAVVIALTRPLDGSRLARKQLVGAGALTGFAILYSHDFGVPAALATWIGLASEALVRRANEPLRARARGAAREVLVYAMGLAAILLPFLLFYAARGKLVALLRGYLWTVQVSSGRVAFPGREWAFASAFDSLAELCRQWDRGVSVVARGLDFVLAPGLAILGLAHAMTALVQRRFTRRTTLILALAILVAAGMHHAFLAADAWHFENASTPALVLLLALAAGGRGLFVRWRGSRPVALGVMAAATLPAFWVLNGGPDLIKMRLARIAAGEERPSTGDPHTYADIPRAGDVEIGPEHLVPVRWVREHSGPDDPVFCTTWMLGGGTEAFLSQRRNPTSFDKPDEVSGPPQRRQLQRELEADPPRLIVGKFFDYLDDETRRYIEHGWHVVATDGAPVRQRNP